MNRILYIYRADILYTCEIFMKQIPFESLTTENTGILCNLFRRVAAKYNIHIYSPPTLK